MCVTGEPSCYFRSREGLQEAKQTSAAGIFLSRIRQELLHQVSGFMNAKACMCARAVNTFGMNIKHKKAAELRARQQALQMGDFQTMKKPPSFRLVFNKQECNELFPLLTLTASKGKQADFLLGMKHKDAAQVSLGFSPGSLWMCTVVCRPHRMCVRSTFAALLKIIHTPQRADRSRPSAPQGQSTCRPPSPEYHRSGHACHAQP